MSKKERLKHTDCELSWSPESSLQMRKQARGPPAPLSVGKASSDLDAAPRGPEMPATQPSSSQQPCTVFLSSSMPTAARAQAQRAHLWHISRHFFYAVWALACPRADGRPAAASDAHTDGLPLQRTIPKHGYQCYQGPAHWAGLSAMAPERVTAERAQTSLEAGDRSFQGSGFLTAQIRYGCHTPY